MNPLAVPKTLTTDSLRPKVLSSPTDVRFGSLADIVQRPRHVRFTPDSGHSPVQVGCPLSAISGHLQKQGAGTLASGSKTDRSTDIAGVRLAEADISRPEARPPVTLVATEG
jgi:hypothetical protein